MQIFVSPDGLISGSNKVVEFQVMLHVPNVDLTPLTSKEEPEEGDFRGAPYSYKFDQRGNFISAMGWDRDAVVDIVNFFLKYLNKGINRTDIEVRSTVK